MSAQPRTWMAAIAVLVVVCARGLAAQKAAASDAAQPKIQVAVLLDNSGSMEGLIEQAKVQLWSFINDLATTKKNGKAPVVEVALYTYNYPPPTKVLDLTTDLDLVSQKLFEIKTSGGDEFCGMVIRDAVENLKWSENPDDLKVIFIAGNEPFTQGPVDFHESCKSAITRGIIVNTIHCGAYQEGVDGKWKDGALLAEGSYLAIDQNAKIVHIDAPQDKEIARLGEDLNKTYVPYGAHGEAGRANQAAQDTNASSVSAGNNASRQAAKASSQYRNANWDLVDALKENKVKLAQVKDEDLPEVMRPMNLQQRNAYVESQGARRAEVQKQITDLSRQREQYVAQERAKQDKDGKSTLDKAVVETLRGQAAKKNFSRE